MNILDEAKETVDKKRKGYGEIEKSFDNTAKLWSVILGKEISGRDVTMCMIALKLSREVSSHKTDNLIDIAGYAYIQSKLENQVEEVHGGTKQCVMPNALSTCC